MRSEPDLNLGLLLHLEDENEILRANKNWTLFTMENYPELLDALQAKNRR